MDYSYAPFYFTNGFMDCEDARMCQDMNYMKQLYPKTVRDVQKIIEDECDRLEFPGSFIYDEYPDRVRLDLEKKTICDRARKDESTLDEKVLGDIVYVLLCTEICKRRSNRRKYFHIY